MSQQQGGLISEDFIRALLEKIDIVELIHKSVPLKKAGANHVACCPFHHEKSPSFTVSANKQFYHCFGCGANGDAISFLRAFNHLEFVDAVEQLAGMAGVPLPETQTHQAKATQQSYKPYLDLLDEVASFFERCLKSHTSNQIPIQYLKSRGLDGVTAKTFRVGYAPNEWHSLTDHFQEDAIKINLLEKLGLVIRHEKGHFFDRFRHRIIFPIRNRKGEVIGFGGRVISSKDNPKYMNSPESLIFKKGNHLYGRFEAQQVHQKWHKAICVEGYLDVIGLYQQGVPGAFATMGTALTSFHVKQLFQMSSEIIFCFDGDKAGRQAAWKALEVLLPNYLEQKQVKFLFLPEGEDPDSYIRVEGKDKFVAHLENSLSLSEYFFSTLCERYPPDNVENRAQLIRTGRQYIEQLPKSTYQSMMMEALAQLTSTSQQIVSQKYNFLSKDRKHNYPYRKQGGFNRGGGITAAPPALLGPAYIASGLLISEPSLIQFVQKQPIWEHINMPGLSLLKALCDLLTESVDFNSDQVIEKLLTRGFTRNLVQQCFSKVKFVPTNGRKAELVGSIDRILDLGKGQIVEHLLKTSQTRELNVEEKAILKKFLTFRESSNDNGL